MTIVNLQGVVVETCDLGDGRTNYKLRSLTGDEFWLTGDLIDAFAPKMEGATEDDEPVASPGTEPVAESAKPKTRAKKG